MSDADFRIGTAATMLGVNVHHLRRLCETRLVDATLTEGRHWRISDEEIQRLKREGVPALPAGSRVEELTKSRSTQTCAADGYICPEVEEAEEYLQSQDRILRYQEVKIGLEETRARLRELNAKREADERARLRAIEAEKAAAKAAQKRQDWREDSLRRAMGLMPKDAPVEIRKQAYEAADKLIRGFDPDDADRVVEELLAAEVRKAANAWKRKLAIEAAIRSASDVLPAEAKGRGELSSWELGARERTAEAVGRLRPEASVEEVNATAKYAGRLVAGRYRHLRLCEQVVDSVHLPGVSPEIEARMKAAVEDALDHLPVGASRATMETVKNDLIAKFGSGSDPS